MEKNNNKSDNLGENLLGNNDSENKRLSHRFFSESEPAVSAKDAIGKLQKGIEYLENTLAAINKVKSDKPDPSIQEAQQVVRNCADQIEKTLQPEPVHSPPKSSPS